MLREQNSAKLIQRRWKAKKSESGGGSNSSSEEEMPTLLNLETGEFDYEMDN